MKTKTILASKTFWLNVLALLLLLWPAAKAWVAANPVEPVVALGALNVLLRFLTAGGVSLFGTDETDETISEDRPGTGTNGAAMWVTWLGLGSLAGFLGFSLPSCNPGQVEALKQTPVKVCYIDQSGAKVCYSTKEGLEATLDQRTAESGLIYPAPPAVDPESGK